MPLNSLSVFPGEDQYLGSPYRAGRLWRTISEVVANLLEEGRKIVDQEKIAPFYQKVSVAILDEAPMVHMGFNKAVAIYRNDLVKVSGRILRRNEGHLHIFEAK